MTDVERIERSRKQLRLAVNGMWVLGILLLVCTGLSSVGVILPIVSGDAQAEVLVFQMIGLCVYLLPAVALMVAAYYTGRYQLWALILGTVVVSLVLLFALVGVAGIAITLVAVDDGSAGLPLLIGGGVALLLMLVPALVLTYTIRAYPAVNAGPADELRRGFEVVSSGS